MSHTKRLAEILSRVNDILVVKRVGGSDPYLVLSYINSDMLHYEYFDTPEDCNTAWEEMATLLLFACTHPFVRTGDILFQPKRARKLTYYDKDGIHYFVIVFSVNNNDKNLAYGFKTTEARDNFYTNMLPLFENDESPEGDGQNKTA